MQRRGKLTPNPSPSPPSAILTTPAVFFQLRGKNKPFSNQKQPNFSGIFLRFQVTCFVLLCLLHRKYRLQLLGHQMALCGCLKFHRLNLLLIILLGIIIIIILLLLLLPSPHSSPSPPSASAMTFPFSFVAIHQVFSIFFQLNLVLPALSLPNG